MVKNQKDVVFEGFDELKAKFEVMNELVAFEAAHDAVFAAAKVIEAEWKARIAAQPWRESEGHFEESIEARFIKSRRKNAAAATVTRRWIGVPENEQPLWYGHKLEFGTAMQPARPTGRPAFDSAKGAAMDSANAIIRADIEELVRNA